MAEACLYLIISLLFTIVVGAFFSLDRAEICALLALYLAIRAFIKTYERGE